MQQIIDRDKVHIESIYLSSDRFVPSIYIANVLKNDSLKDVKAGIHRLKKKLDGHTQDSNKVQLIIENYDQFLAAKKVLDRIHDKFLENPGTERTLQALEDGMSHL